MFRDETVQHKGRVRNFSLHGPLRTLNRESPFVCPEANNLIVDGLGLGHE